MPMTITTQDLQQKEWQAARDVIVKYDDQLDGLRKYGFTFITGLLTAQSLLTTIEPSLKVSVILVTLVLIVALRLLDRYYQLLQKAAIKRAIVIEKCLNLELTETTFDVYHHRRLYVWLNLIYGLFAGGAGLIGLFLITSFGWEEVVIGVATLATIIVVLLIPDLIKLESMFLYTFDELKVT